MDIFTLWPLNGFSFADLVLIAYIDLPAITIAGSLPVSAQIIGTNHYPNHSRSLFMPVVQQLNNSMQHSKLCGRKDASVQEPTCSYKIHVAKAGLRETTTKPIDQT